MEQGVLLRSRLPRHSALRQERLVDGRAWIIDRCGAAGAHRQANPACSLRRPGETSLLRVSELISVPRDADHHTRDGYAPIAMFVHRE